MTLADVERRRHE